MKLGTLSLKLGIETRYTNLICRSFVYHFRVPLVLKYVKQKFQIFLKKLQKLNLLILAFPDKMKKFNGTVLQS